jgi:hypothetical protein
MLQLVSSGASSYGSLPSAVPSTRPGLRSVRYGARDVWRAARRRAVYAAAAVVMTGRRLNLRRRIFGV